MKKILPALALAAALLAGPAAWRAHHRWYKARRRSNDRPTGTTKPARR